MKTPLHKHIILLITFLLTNISSYGQSVSPSFVNIPTTGGSVTVNITAPSNMNWDVSAPQFSWLTITPQSVISPAYGTGNGTITITCPANTSSNSNFANITINFWGGNPESILVNQDGKSGPGGNDNISITSPTSSNNWQVGTSQNITWTSNFNDNIKIDLYTGNTFNQTIVLAFR